MAKAKIDDSYRYQPDNLDLDHIPGRDGLPIIGRMIAVVTDYLKVLEEHKGKWGNISRIKMLPNRTVMVLGADNWQRVLLDREQNFSAEMGYKETLGMFYEGGVLLRDFDAHKKGRRLFQTAFKTDAMRGYVDRMTPIMDKHIKGWSSEIEFFGSIKKALLDVGSSVFVGLDDNKDAEEFNNSFLHINEGLVGIVKKEIPFTAYGRGKKGKRYLMQAFEKLVNKARQNPDNNDMLTKISNERDENGEFYAMEEVCNHLVFLLFAAHDTTTSALCHIIYYTAANPEWQQKLREEYQALGKDALDYEDLDKLTITDLVFDEAQRLRPSVPLMMRRTIRDCEFEGYHIPANTVLSLPNMYNHRDPEHWTNPTKFDPMRFAEGREEHKNHSFCYHPFGGGAHKCIGMHFARMLTKTFLFNFVSNYEYSLPQGFEVEFEWFPLPKPKKLPIQLKKTG